ncbi:MAG: hypothetical protein ABSE62_10355 [Chthoniobacteraceae bacterium]|jgi:hypothetical protein
MELKEEISLLREQVQALRQCLEGFAGAMGLVAQVNDATKRLSAIERAHERAKGAYSVLAFIWGGIAAVSTVMIDHHFFSK